jgi:hypothetical protein
MTNEIVTTEVIIGWLKDNIEQKIPIAPSRFIDAAQKLNVLLSDEHAKLFKMQQVVAQMKAELMEGDSTAAKAKIMVEASNEYAAYCIQKAYIGRIEEMIRIAKIQARLKDNEYKSGF